MSSDECIRLEARYQHACKHKNYNIYKESAAMEQGRRHVCEYQDVNGKSLPELLESIQTYLTWYDRSKKCWTLRKVYKFKCVHPRNRTRSHNYPINAGRLFSAKCLEQYTKVKKFTDSLSM